jgi:hypothetical protein
MWLAERDACSEARATIRMSRYSLYTAARRRPEGIPPSGAPRGDSVLRSGGVAVRRAALCTGARRPDPRDPDRAPPGSARSRSRAESYVCVRRVCAVGVRPLVAPSLGIRANSGLSSGRCRARARRAVGSRIPTRVVRSWTQRTGRVQWTRGVTRGCQSWWRIRPRDRGPMARPPVGGRVRRVIAYP